MTDQRLRHLHRFNRSEPRMPQMMLSASEEYAPLGVLYPCPLAPAMILKPAMAAYHRLRGGFIDLCLGEG